MKSGLPPALPPHRPAQAAGRFRHLRHKTDFARKRLAIQSKCRTFALEFKQVFLRAVRANFRATEVLFNGI